MQITNKIKKKKKNFSNCKLFLQIPLAVFVMVWNTIETTVMSWIFSTSDWNFSWKLKAVLTNDYMLHFCDLNDFIHLHRPAVTCVSAQNIWTIWECLTTLSLPHFDLICHLFLNRRTAKWNLFAKSMTVLQSYWCLREPFPFSLQVQH